MCDYSLERVPSRPAKVADRVMVKTFANTSTRGFADMEDLGTAVCLRPGTELAFTAPIRYYGRSLMPWPKTSPSKLARFRQINMDLPYAHHDALELPDGTVVPVTRLVARQTATILQLPHDDTVTTPASWVAAVVE